MNFVVWVLLVFAVYRLAEVVSTDTISEPIRLWIGKRTDNKTWKFLADLLNCPYCTGVWIAFLGAWILKPTGVLTFIVYWLSLAGGQAFLESITKEREL